MHRKMKRMNLHSFNGIFCYLHVITILFLVIWLQYSYSFVKLSIPSKLKISSLSNILKLYYRDKKSNSDQKKQFKASFPSDSNYKSDSNKRNYNYGTKKNTINRMGPQFDRNTWQQSDPGLFVLTLQKMLENSSSSSSSSSNANDVNNEPSERDDFKDSRLLEEGSLRILLASHLPMMTPSMIASTVYSVAMLKHRQIIKSFANADRLILLRALYDCIDSMNANDFSLSLQGLARLSVEYRDVIRLHPTFLSNLMEILLQVNSGQIGDVLWSLASINCNWSILTIEYRHNIITNVERFRGKGYDSYTLSSVIWALAKLGAKWSEFTLDFRKEVIEQLQSNSFTLSPHQSSKVLWALGTLGCIYSQDLSNEFLELYIENINLIKRSQIGNAISAGQTLTGVAKLGVNWNRLSKSIRSGLWEQLMRISISPNDKALANAIWAMGTIEAPSITQPQVVYEKMMDSIRRVLNDCSSWSLCNMIWGLTRMGFRWNDFDEKFQEAITMNIVRVASSMNNIDIGILIWSLGNLETPLDRFPSYVLDCLYESILSNVGKMKPEALSRMLWGLSGSGLSWDNLPNALRWNINSSLRRLAPDMNSQDIANSAYAFAILSFDSENAYDPAFRGAHEALLTRIQQSSKKFSQVTDPNILSTDSVMLSSVSMMEFEQLRIFANYLIAHQRVSDTSRIPSILLQSITTESSPNVSPSPSMISSISSSSFSSLEMTSDLSMGQPSLTSSSLQNKVLSSLAESLQSSVLSNKDDIRIEIEYSGFQGVYPVDAAIFKHNVLIALVEVDGPHHYRYDGTLRRIDGLKESMYKNMNPDIQFHRIRWDETTKLGTEAITDELASSILIHAKKLKPWTGALRNFERKCSAFFSWSLRSEDSLF